MKKSFTAIVIASGLLASNLYANLDYGDTGTVAMAPGTYEFGNGGEFTATTTGIPGISAPFQTFCIEYNEEFVLNSSYHVTINSGAVAGDAGANTTDPFINGGVGMPMDNISIGTAWLYSAFRNNLLTGSLAVNSAQAAGNLQAAIWYLEGETSALSVNVGYGTQDGTAYFNAAVGALTGKTYGGITIGSGNFGAQTDTGVNNALGHPETTTTGIFADSGGAYNVVAMNLFSTTDTEGSTEVTLGGVNYYLNQDQLAIVPEPTTLIAGAMLLLPFGASTLRFVRKHRTT